MKEVHDDQIGGFLSNFKSKKTLKMEEFPGALLHWTFTKDPHKNYWAVTASTRSVYWFFFFFFTAALINL